MAIDRLKNPFGSTQVTSGLAPENWAYASAQTGGVTPFTFTGDGTAGTVNGATYRVHEWNYASGSPGFDITFSQAGIIDLLVCAGGGAGGGQYITPFNTNAGYAGGGGGGAGLILQYSYGVTASTYSLTVGVGGTPEIASATNTNIGHGGDSTFGSLTAVGGGCAPRGYTNSSGNVHSGGSGSGGASGSNTNKSGGTGTSGQGNQGGNASPIDTASITTISGHTPNGDGYGIIGGGGGGGGYSGPGTDGKPQYNDLLTLKGGDGGDGIELRFDGTLRGFAAGGAGGVTVTNASAGSAVGGTGGTGGGGDGQIGNSGDGNNATGFGCGGGGAAGSWATGGNHKGGYGSDGIVIVRYRIG
jgi:hypothetical protein